ncbi:carboxypeptidase-like regulatory domain-containing protein [Riemerella anatipestifer]|nr:carboxypeptidase-like regulatory domain-containing protein [Riemerella anatipestifer]
MLKTVLLFLLFPLFSFAQFKITGKIVNEKNNPVEFIEVQLQNKDSIIFKSELTDIDGKFILETEKGKYTLLVRQLGIIYYRENIDVNQDTNLGVINIIEKTQELKEIVLTSKKKLLERKVDRLIFNVENSVAVTGGNALDALKITPRVKVVNEQISMIGKGGMMIMLNDRPLQLSGDDLSNFLKTLNAEDLKK